MTFSDAVMAGLAPDGGLLIPGSIPSIGARLEAWSRLGYAELAFEILRPFCDLPDAVLRNLLESSTRGFAHPDVVTLRPAGGIHILELFHGPTLAFKDIALQWLGRLFGYLLEQRGGRLNLLAATSGDTGSAAIHGVRGIPRVSIFVMHPRRRISPLQERQMTTVLDANVHNLAIEGSFDDAQRIMKALFRDTDFKTRHALGAVNSVNWARVLAQIVYYVYAYLRVRRAQGAERIRFAVPTGNFGDILAGYYAFRMGLPVDRLVLATNENDILVRYFDRGEYRPQQAQSTPSPSMDIQVASNFERYLYYRLGGDPRRVAALMAAFERDGELTVTPPQIPSEVLFAARRIGREETLETIRRYARMYQVVLDPHTAVGVAAAEPYTEPGLPVVALATAHPAKFPEAVRAALGDREIVRHPRLEALERQPTRCRVLPASEDAVRDYLDSVTRGQDGG